MKLGSHTELKVSVMWLQCKRIFLPVFWKSQSLRVWVLTIFSGYNAKILTEVQISIKGKLSLAYMSEWNYNSGFLAISKVCAKTPYHTWLYCRLLLPTPDIHQGEAHLITILSNPCADVSLSCKGSLGGPCLHSYGGLLYPRSMLYSLWLAVRFLVLVGLQTGRLWLPFVYFSILSRLVTRDCHSVIWDTFSVGCDQRNTRGILWLEARALLSTPRLPGTAPHWKYLPPDSKVIDVSILFQ